MKTGIIKLEELNLTNYEEIINSKKGFLIYQNIVTFIKDVKVI